MLSGISGAALLGLSVWWGSGSEWRPADRHRRVWKRKVRGGVLSVAPYDARGSTDYHMVFFSKTGFQIDGGRLGVYAPKEAMQLADRWWKAGMPGGVRIE